MRHYARYRSTILLYMCQSRVEIKHYSVVYFDRITVFNALLCSTSIKGGAHLHSHYVDLSGIHASLLHV